MPGLDTDLHRKMLADHRRQHAWHRRLLRWIAGRPGPGDEIYGMQWGDPETDPPLVSVRKHFLEPFVGPEVVAVEIGPGGGRWTRYLLPCRTVYAVDVYKELLDELQTHFRQPNLIPILNNGTDFPGVADAGVDFIISFGTFVHLDLDLIVEYLASMRRILKPQGTAVIQYADKTKPDAQRNRRFSENTPEIMRSMVTRAGFVIQDEDTTTLRHSAVVRFGLDASSASRRRMAMSST